MGEGESSKVGQPGLGVIKESFQKHFEIRGKVR